MNLPSIFKSAPNMKSTNPQNKNEKFDMNVPQDMFGLGIQVFKIESKKEILGNTKSVGKVRQEIKAIENPKKIINVPPIPKPKKTSAVLPSINKTPSEKQYKLESITKTDSIISRKSIQKPSSNPFKMDVIQEYSHQQPTANKLNKQQKNKTFTMTRPGNKSVECQPQSENVQEKRLVKQQWRTNLNQVRRFLTQYNQYKSNQQTKEGRRRNIQYIKQQQDFIQAYIQNNESSFAFQSEDLYDPLSIQNYQDTMKLWESEQKNI